MRTLGAGTALLAAAALAAPVAPAAAAPTFSATTPGLTGTTLGPGTYDIVATGASGTTASRLPRPSTRCSQARPAPGRETARHGAAAARTDAPL